MKVDRNLISELQHKLIKQSEEEKMIETKKNESIGFSNNRMKSSKSVSENSSDK